MTISASVLEAMLKAGCTAEQLVAVVRADEEANAERLADKREKNRIRQQNHRARNALSRVTECDKRDLLPPEGSFPTPLSPNPLTSLPPSPPKGGSSPTDFEAFWAKYPHKVGKRDAEKAFSQAIRRDSLDAIMAGLERYARKTDDRPWCNPSTFLNQDRWADAPAVVAPHRSGTSPPLGNRRRNYLDAALDLIGDQENGPENSFGNGSNVEFLPPRKQRSGPDVADISEHPWQPVITGNH
ncbi:hypothetical protein ACTJJ7_20090 [Phyllobacterium sp. 22229]|uniref:hypothetical protein n=1 Tax=Phyllobacterium sp. 22229 TaxID=3453895 RepID=UPI003F83A360